MKGCWLVLAAFAVSLLTDLASPLNIVTATSVQPLERWGFYVTYDPTSRTSLLAHLSDLDVVAPDYFSLDLAGSVDRSSDPAVDSAIERAGKLNVPLVQNQLSYASLTPYLTDSSRRATLTTALCRQIEANGYDGLTLDFEGVNASDRTAFSQFVRELALELHSKRKLLAVAVPAETSENGSVWASAYDDASIGASADRIIIMAYGYRTDRGAPGPISPLPWVTAVSSFAATALPTDKVILGIGAWGYDWAIGTTQPASVLRYDETAAVMDANPGQHSYDGANASAEYAYRQRGQPHQIWFETAQSLAAKIAIATQSGFRGIALWRLGQEDRGLWTHFESSALADHAIPNGWYFLEAGGGTGLGYRVYDDQIRFWTEFNRLGGVVTLGYPASRRFVGADGFTYQVFQRGVLQWRPEIGVAFLANTFDELSAAHQDQKLEQQGIPAPVSDDGSHSDWQLARSIRLAWLTQPDIARAFYANPNPQEITVWNADESIQLYGLPTSAPVRNGPFIVQRFQRVSLQLWLDSVPGIPAPGSVVGILGGDLVKRAGIVPSQAMQPESAAGD